MKMCFAASLLTQDSLPICILNIWQLKLLSVCSLQYLKVVRSLEGYGELTFPHCPCDARKSGHVIPTLTFNQFKLQACSDDGTLEVSLLDSLSAGLQVTFCIPRLYPTRLPKLYPELMWCFINSFFTSR